VNRFALALLIALCSCGSVETHRYATAPPRASTEDAAVVPDVPARPFVEAGFVQAIAYGTEAVPAAVTRALAREGRAMGCDAVVRTRIDEAPGMLHASGVCARWVVQLPQEAAPATK
jgi:hypothetical protein